MNELKIMSYGPTFGLKTEKTTIKEACLEFKRACEISGVLLYEFHPIQLWIQDENGLIIEKIERGFTKKDQTKFDKLLKEIDWEDFDEEE